MANLLERVTTEIIETSGMKASDYCHVSRGRSPSSVSVSISFVPSKRLHGCICRALRRKNSRGNLKFLSTLISQGKLGAWDSQYQYDFGLDDGYSHGPYFCNAEDEQGVLLSHPYHDSTMYLEFMACAVVLAEVEERLLAGQLATE